MSSRALLPVVLGALVGCTRSAAPVATLPANSPAGDVDARVRRLEEKLDRYAEALEFLRKVYEQQKSAQRQQTDTELDPDGMFAVEIAADLKLGKVDGPKTAAVTIVEAFDFACPYCNRMASVMDELVKEYGGKVRVVDKDLIIHTDVAMPAHLAACAAAQQGKYQPYKAALWEKGYRPYEDTRDRTSLAEPNLLAIAKDLHLDVKRLEADMKGTACRDLITADMAELAKFKIDGTPAFFVNGRHIAGAMPKEAFKVLIDEQLAAVSASGVPAAEYYDRVVMTKGEKTFRAAAPAK